MDLRAGVYWFAFTAVGSQPVQVGWILKSQPLDPESLVDNGVGQSPALSLRLLNPSSSSLTSDSPAGPETMLGGNTANPPAAPTSVSVLSPIPSSLLVTVSTGLLGRPSSQSEAVAAVGPVVAGGYVAMADGTLGLLPGLLDRPYRPDDLPRIDGHPGRGIPRRLVRRGVRRHDPRRPCGWQDRGRGAGSTGTRQGRSDHRARGPAGPLVRRGRGDRRINALGRKPRPSRNDPTPSVCRCWPERDSIGSATRVPIASSMPSWEYRPRWCSSRPRRTGYASSRPAGGEGLGGLRLPDHTRAGSPPGRTPPAGSRACRPDRLRLLATEAGPGQHVPPGARDRPAQSGRW